MKVLKVTKERFERSRYFQSKYGKLEYVSESGKVFKTSKGHVLKFVKESSSDDIYGDSCQEGTESNPRFKCMEDVGVTSSSGGHHVAFLTDMVAGFLEKQRGIDSVEHGDEGILVTFSDGGQVVVSFESV